jgi:hypothetical protein
VSETAFLHATPTRTAPVMALPRFRASGDIALLRDRQLGGAVSPRHTGGDPCVTRRMLTSRDGVPRPGFRRGDRAVALIAILHGSAAHTTNRLGIVELWRSLIMPCRTGAFASRRALTSAVSRGVQARPSCSLARMPAERLAIGAPNDDGLDVVIPMTSLSVSRSTSTERRTPARALGEAAGFRGCALRPACPCPRTARPTDDGEDGFEADSSFPTVRR